MAPTRVPAPLGRSVVPPIDCGTLCRSASPNPGPFGTGPTHPDMPDPSLRELNALGLDLLQMALDLAGIFDPTPVSDGASGLLALARGQWLDAVISGASMIPYVGDLAKMGKLPKYLKLLERAFELADKSADAAKALLPGMRKLEQVLDLLPAGANRQIDQMRKKVDDFVSSHTMAALAKQLPDISNRFAFRGPYPMMHGGKKYSVREAEGAPGIPGKVPEVRDGRPSEGEGIHARRCESTPLARGRVGRDCTGRQGHPFYVAQVPQHAHR